MAPLMAEYVVHAALRYAREFDGMDDDRRAGRWVPRRPTERADYPVGVMGAGALGVPVAQALAAHGFPVALWSRTPRAVDGIRGFAGADALGPFLASTRILVCLLPLTPETEDILDAALFRQLLPNAYLINVARGRHLVDADLLDAIARRAPGRGDARRVPRGTVAGHPSVLGRAAHRDHAALFGADAAAGDDRRRSPKRSGSSNGASRSPASSIAVAGIDAQSRGSCPQFISE